MGTIPQYFTPHPRYRYVPSPSPHLPLHPPLRMQDHPSHSDSSDDMSKARRILRVLAVLLDNKVAPPPPCVSSIFVCVFLSLSVYECVCLSDAAPLGYAAGVSPSGSSLVRFPSHTTWMYSCHHAMSHLSPPL